MFDAPDPARVAGASVVEDVTKVLNYGDESVSVEFEEVEPQDWADKVYKPDIIRNSEQLYKKPGYTT